MIAFVCIAFLLFLLLAATASGFIAEAGRREGVTK